MKPFFFILTFLWSIENMHGQKHSEKSIYLKGNALFLPVAMINLGIETRISEKYTLQADTFISPWRSFLGNHAQLYMGHLEGRYYFRKVFEKWYIGVNSGFGFFDVTKWNYLGTGKYQRGFNYMLGATIGYQFQWKEKWNIDLYFGGGTSQGFYHGYQNLDHYSYRYESHPKGWNHSGEWIPYRGGIMVAYRLH